jgi:hypothetical protein
MVVSKGKKRSGNALLEGGWVVKSRRWGGVVKILSAARARRAQAQPGRNSLRGEKYCGGQGARLKGEGTWTKQFACERFALSARARDERA